LKLTETQVAKLECPAGKKDVLIFDEVQRGLALRVTAGGSRSYLVQYSFGGSKRRVPLGDLTLAKARSVAAEILGNVAAGRDPAGDRKAAHLAAKAKAARVELTLGVLVDQWAALSLSDRRASYAHEAVRAIKVAFAKLLPLAAADLDRPTVVRVLDVLTKDGKPAMARSTAAYGRACYGWAVKRGSIDVNPFVNLPLSAPVKRDRVLTDAELRSIWQATAKAGSFNSIVRMLMLTGQREGEVAGMAWAELSDDFAVWKIPASRAKNGVDSIVPLSPQARAIVAGAVRYEGNPRVFPGENGGFSGWSKAKARLDRDSRVKGWRLHDLRRTLATNLQKLGVRLEVTEAVLNHVSGSRAGIVGIYQRHDWAEEKRAALNAWGEHIAAIVEGRTAAENVTRLRRSA
jgi:integrase